ncbi:thymidine kinase [Vibrio crassostreae]|uniref:thymidine kinase n=1 Tax=Vibrio crassostreae TaxID=246167 RepID=UPI001B301EFA|nr:thymidine kinase [Vibrio crassostreae]
MAKVYFYYSAMNSGKSTSLLQSSFNYQERGMNTLLFNFYLDDRMGKGKVASRIGLSEEAIMFSAETSIKEHFLKAHNESPLGCVFIDEAQFLTKEQVSEITDIADDYDVPVMCYGLRTDYLGELFEGSKYLLAWADKLVEQKGICQCGSKAVRVVRLDAVGNAVTSGEQISIGAESQYVSVCRKHYKAALKGDFEVHQVVPSKEK